MRTFDMAIQFNKLFLVFLTLFLMSACGGGGGSSATTPPVVTPPPPPTGGITRTGVAFAVGPITGFGSVIVNGVRYDTSGALFTKDGVDAFQEDFEVGHTVVVKGTIDDDNTNAFATNVDFSDNVEGRVTDFDVETNTFVVLGQTVFLGTGLSRDDSCPTELQDFVGVVVEVSGSVDDDGVIVATRIECKDVLGEMEVTGTVSNLDVDTKKFNINALVVDYNGAAMDNFSGSIANDDPVEAKGTELGGTNDDELIATRVEFKGPRFDTAEGDHLEIEGFITDFTDDRMFTVSDQPVVTTDTTDFEGGERADLRLNLKVEVEGETDADNILVATKVQIKASNAVRVTGIVDGVEVPDVTVDAGTLVVLGITITVDSLTTRKEDKSAAGLESLSLMDIQIGQYVEVRGQEAPGDVDNGQPEVVLAASLLEREDPRDRTELRGFVETVGEDPPRSLTILGVTVTTDNNTIYRDEAEQSMDVDDFWLAVSVGTLVDVNSAGATPMVTSILAEELSLENVN
jgi:hypothetical protein